METKGRVSFRICSTRLALTPLHAPRATFLAFLASLPRLPFYSYFSFQEHPNEVVRRHAADASREVSFNCPAETRNPLRDGSCRFQK